MVCPNTYAQKWKSSAQLSKGNLSAIHQRALQHAQKLRELKLARLGITPNPAAPTILEQSQPAIESFRKPAPRTPDKWLADLEDFIAKNGRYPKRSATDPAEEKLCRAVYAILARSKQDTPVTQRIRQLRQLYPLPTILTPQQRIEKLEDFIAKNGRFPSQASEDPQESALYSAVNHLKHHLAPNDPLVLRANELRKQYPPARRKITPQERLHMLEEFIEKHGHFPLSVSIDSHESNLYAAINKLRRLLDAQDPILLRINELHQQYASGKSNTTPQEWLNRLEEFVAKNKRFPSPSSKQVQEVKIYRATYLLRRRMDPTHPIAARIDELRNQYPLNTSAPGPQSPDAE